MKIIIDPGHGGFDNGATYEGRKEKDDTLRLALAVGEGLAQQGYDIFYTRQTDRYDSPYEKAQMANRSEGDVFLSFHRNNGIEPDLYDGVMALVYSDNPISNRLATDINAQLEKVGYKNLGLEKREELVVLRKTTMPAVLLEVGFLNSKKDNELFTKYFDETKSAIIEGVKDALPLQRDIQTLSVEDNKDMQKKECKSCQAGSVQREEEKEIQIPAMVRFYVQVGLFRYPENAAYLLEQLKGQGHDGVWRKVAGLIAIWVGDFDTVEQALVKQEQLHELGYDTLIVTEQSDRSGENEKGV